MTNTLCSIFLSASCHEHKRADVHEGVHVNAAAEAVAAATDLIASSKSHTHRPTPTAESETAGF